MHDVHTIHLRGPWQLKPVERYTKGANAEFFASTDDLPPSVTAKVPASWSAMLEGRFFGKVIYTRRFHAPGGLEEGEQVWLVVEPPRTGGLISVNGQALGEVQWGRPAARFEIATLLKEYNLLEIVVMHPQLDVTGRPVDDDYPQHHGGLVGEVRLEIGFP